MAVTDQLVGMSRPNRRWLGPCLMAGGVALAALSGRPALPATANDAPQVAVVQSETASIVREVRLTGTVTSPRAASLSTQVAGLVARLAVEEGDRVDADQLLLELDRELAAHRLETVQAQAQRAKAELADARRRLTEGRRLARDGNIPRSDLESREAEAAKAEAALAAARAETRHQASVLERHAIRAPFAGVISRRETELGEWVVPGTTVLELVSMDGLRFEFRAAQELYPLLDENTAVTLRLDAFPERRFAGRMAAIVPVSDPAARTFLLRVLPVGEDHPAMTPGMSAAATLAVDTGRSGVVVPRDALLRHPDGRVSVWTLDGSGENPRVREQQVRPGLEFGGRVEVRDGLQTGVPVVVEGNEVLQEGQAVRVRSERSVPARG